MSPERVVLLDEDGTPVGTELKAVVHSTTTPLHLAFSCHLFNAAGQVLVTRRALHKRTWPGVWTNSFCGHPRPDESIDDAVVRRAREELGLTLHGLTMQIPDFRYRATDATGTVENELCPVYMAFVDDAPSLDPDEVMEARWSDPAALGSALHAAPWAFSPWFVLQAAEMSQYTISVPSERAYR